MWMDVRECADVRCLAMMNGEADVAGSHQISFRRGLHSQSLVGWCRAGRVIEDIPDSLKAF